MALNVTRTSNAALDVRCSPTWSSVQRCPGDYSKCRRRWKNQGMAHCMWATEPCSPSPTSSAISLRMTSLLGLPGSGKSSLLLDLAGKLDKDMRGSSHITYNGHRLGEFIPERTAAYVSQIDKHIGELTVRGDVGFRALTLSRSWLLPDYVLKVLGLEICADTLVGNDMIRGISGGQKNRVTTGEVLVGPRKTLFMDEISTGLDSSTTSQIVTCMRNFTRFLEGTVFMALLQPPQESFNLFDDICSSL